MGEEEAKERSKGAGNLAACGVAVVSHGSVRLLWEVVMGEVIRKDAAASDIAADAKTTLANATARGSVWKELADEKLGPAGVLLQ
jgi:hypothetical protein